MALFAPTPRRTAPLNLTLHDPFQVHLNHMNRTVHQDA